MHFRVSRIPVLAAVLVLLMTAYLVWQTEEFEDALAHATLDVGGQIAIPSSKDVLQGEMINGGDNFKDRFKSDEHYLLSGHIAGWNNQVISYANTVHLALLSSRVPILPAFLGHPSQLGGSSLVTDPDPRLAFSAIFDLPRLVSALQAKHPGFRGIVDYTEVVEIGHWPAPPNGQQIETSSMVPEDGWWELGCWKCFIDRLDFTYERYHIKPVFTDVPPAVLPSPLHPQFDVLAAYLHPESDLVDEYLAMLADNNTAPRPLPNTNMACVDNLYFAVSSPDAWSPSEWNGQYGSEVGAWSTVGREMKWSADLERKGRIIAHRLFGLKEGNNNNQEPAEEWVLPPFIAVHIRHGDFLKLPECLDRPEGTCLQLSEYVASVGEVQQLLLDAGHGRVDRVLFTTDETDEAFLGSLEGRGWIRVSDELSREIRELWGDWYPMLIDNWLLSKGIGFVGTDKSTMTILAARRVREWNGGVSRDVRVQP